jgi:hypothetical protein
MPETVGLYRCTEVVAAICESYSALYSEAVCNVIGLAFDPCPFDCLVVVATPERHFFAAEGDDDIALGDIVVTSYPHFGSSMFGDQ